MLRLLINYILKVFELIWVELICGSLIFFPHLNFPLFSYMLPFLFQLVFKAVTLEITDESCAFPLICSHTQGFGSAADAHPDS